VLCVMCLQIAGCFDRHYECIFRKYYAFIID
jgi:hypothetical protein